MLRWVLLFALFCGSANADDMLLLGVSQSRGPSNPAIVFSSISPAFVSTTTPIAGTYSIAAPSGLMSATWGGGCSGSSTITAFSASAGNWSATATTPAAAGGGTPCTLTVTGTGANTGSATSPGVRISAACPAGSAGITGAQCRQFLTTSSTSPWTVPTGFTGTNKIELLGAGDQGRAPSTTRSGDGGASGAYASGVNLSLTGTILFVIGAGMSEVDTTFNGSGYLVAGAGNTLAGGLASGSALALGITGGAGGSTAAGRGGGGGAGAPGPDGAGAAGIASQSGALGGSGGGGGDGGARGISAPSTSGANGGNGGGVSPGTGGVGGAGIGGAGGAGTGGAGGAGGATLFNGGAGGAGQFWDASHGPGGGGGGAGTGTTTGGNGGQYGAGAGGGGFAASVGTDGTPGDGLIVITWQPL